MLNNFKHAQKCVSGLGINTRLIKNPQIQISEPYSALKFSQVFGLRTP